MSSNPRVVVIDDSEIVRATVELALSQHGWDVTSLDNAFGVAARVKQINPQIILLDVNMPLVDGEKLAGILQKLLNGSAKILLHSSMSASELRQKVRATGSDGFVEKTNDPAALDRKLRSFLAA